MYSMELFAEYVDVESSEKKDECSSQRGKGKKISNEVYEYVMKAIVKR